MPLVHEYIMVLKKIMPYMIEFQLPTKYELDIRDSQTATWRDVVWAVFQKINKKRYLLMKYTQKLMDINYQPLNPKGL